MTQIDTIHCKEERNTIVCTTPLQSQILVGITPPPFPTQPTLDCRGLECIGFRVQVQYDTPPKILLSRRISGSYLLLGLEDLALHLRRSSFFHHLFSLLLLSRVQGLGFRVQGFTQSLEEKPGFHVLQVLPQGGGEMGQVVEKPKKAQPGQLVSQLLGAHGGSFFLCANLQIFHHLEFHI